MEQLSDNFNRREFACKGSSCCGGSAPVDSKLVEALQELRDLAGEPIMITSGFRCLAHNSTIRGASQTSQHTVGRAADIVCGSLSPRELMELAEKVKWFKNGGIGLYRTFLHVDVRPNGPARW